MLRGAVIAIAALIFAFSVLGTSVFRTTQPEYAFSEYEPRVQGTQAETETVDYELPHPGLLPDSPLWPAKALRDRVWLLLTSDPVKRAELLLLFADKRILMASSLFEKGKAELGVSTVTKAEKYLEQAFLQQEEAAKKGIDTGGFLQRLAKASLKHEEVLMVLLSMAPPDAKSVIDQTINYPRGIYEKSVQELNERGLSAPERPKRNEISPIQE